MHHLNLVRLWGFCAEKGRRILVYEYVPKGSLDKFLFPARGILKSEEDDAEDELLDPSRPPMLDWNIRYRIALGVARAIAYLHEECLEWVLHCDIKPENILLGDDFCPKISDFGLAKLKKKEDMLRNGASGNVSGRRNNEIQDSLTQSEDWYFPSRLHFDMVDRMVKTAMWCLQDRPEMRPSMGKVAKMLEGTVEMMEPKKPTIFFLAD
ncbi:G-type lectin S-receptor-like serine/threonine-protein kinase [Vitis vinifera]|uniref:G-type lectin S-receptor-like serine/threonine-protein kinase n=1 Tax=Vitis vinifera TaxID=29760 RepID=A0A438HXX1_VITVI|nr:G-type lectin S-receptor-like serine/threonine-protein kinase [Vitis vinifera]